MLSPTKPMAPLNPNAPDYLPVAAFPTQPPTSLFTFSSHFPLPSSSPSFHCSPAPTYQYYQFIPPPPPLLQPDYQPHLCFYAIQHQGWLYDATCCGVRGKLPLYTEDVGFLPSLTTANLLPPGRPPGEEPEGLVLPPPPVYKVQNEEPPPPPSRSSLDAVRRVGSRASGCFYRKGRGAQSNSKGERGFQWHGYACYRRRMWIPKWRNQMKKADSRDGISHEEFQFREVGEQAHGVKNGEGGKNGKTTVMIKNIPNKFTKEMLLELLDEHCIQVNQKLLELEEENKEEHTISQFDFFYLPMDFGSGSNLGYAFVNFTSTDAAWRLHHALHKQGWPFLSSRKVCEVTYARIQGLAALVGHFKNSSFECSSDDYLPVYFVPHRDGSCAWEQHCIGKRTQK